MHRFRRRQRQPFFRVLGSTRRSQVAVMTLRPGQISGEYATEHPASDQVLYVVRGVGRAVVRGRRVALRAGDLLVIVAGEKHQVQNTGRRPLETINVYAPPAY